MRQLICFAALLLLAGCDLIDRDNYQSDYAPPVPPAPEVPDVRRILLEDYTGVRCTNCPRAARKAAQLQTIYGERLVVVAIHAGNFARPLDEHDFRSADSKAYFDHYNISGVPKGIVNRLPFQGESFYADDKWPGAVDALPLQSALGLQVEPDYDESTRNYRVAVKVQTLHSETVPPAAHLLLWLVEDNIVGSQLLEDGQTDKAYTHRHVFRGALNGTWGQRIDHFPPTTGVVLTINSDGLALPTIYNASNCSVVALLTNPDTKEVYQATEVALVKK